ncbi:MAG: hypothetical protein K9G49_09130 [Taibaiella sp.]|nr:hypothetical protein [Taibaiella sp.]
MRRDIELLQQIIGPELALAGGSHILGYETFWVKLNDLLLSPRLQANDLLTLLHDFKVDSAKQLFSGKINDFRHQYVDALANDYLSGFASPTLELLIKTQYAPLLNEIAFKRDLKSAITITERARLTKKLSLTDEELLFDLSDSEMASAFGKIDKKKEQEDIMKKMREWDKEETPAYANNEHISYQVNEPATEYSAASKKETKRIPLSFIKYAAAACFIGAMVWIGVSFYDTGSDRDNTEVAKVDAPAVPGAKIKPAFAEVELSENIIPVQTETGMGFADVGAVKKLPIVIQNVVPRIQSIEDYLNKPQADTSETTLRAIAKEELESLRRLSTSYIFDGEKLQFFQTLDAHVQNSVIKTADKKYYFMSGDNFYQLTISKQQQDLNKITDSPLIEKLERIAFDNKN